MRKIADWKAPGPDYVQGYCVKNFQSMNENLREKYCVDNCSVPD